MTPSKTPALFDFPHGWRFWAPVAGLVVLLTVMDATQTYVGIIGQGRQIAFLRAFLLGLTLWWTLAILAYPVLLLARRYRLDEPGCWQTHAFVHLVAAILFGLTHLSTAAALRVVMGIGPPQGFAFLLGRFIEWLFAVDFFIYWAILGVGYAVHYYRMARERETANAQLSATLTEARLQTLRARLNPHFLFNALNAISVLAMRGEPKSVVSTVANLGDLLRVSLDDALPQQVPLSRELEFLSGYLDIQRVRFLDRLEIEFDIADDVRDALVPSLILQPLVENAIIHGITTRAERGTVTIGAARDRQTLRVSVSDSGPGFQPMALEPGRRGLGLAITEERLAQLYGNAHRIEYGASPSGGALVTLSMPFTPQDGGRLVSTHEVLEAAS